MADQWYYTHKGITHGPVSGVKLRRLVENLGVVSDDLIWPAEVAPSQAVRADSILALPTSVSTAPPAWLRELADAGSAVDEMATLNPPPALSWLADVRRAEQAYSPGEAAQGDARPAVVPTTKPIPDAKVPSPALERLHELAGKPFAHFQVGPLIARGRTGIVFRALDLKDGREAALKVFWPWAVEEGRQTFRLVQSLQMIVPLRHPYLVALYGVGKSGENCWTAMEFVDGENLNQVLDRVGVAGQLDWRHTFRIGYELAQALEFTHGRGLIHGNITPRNVLIRSADRTTMLGDPAQMKALEGDPSKEAGNSGEAVGDVRYMSPERTEGRARVDDRSDVYSLGALMYSLLAGRAPFDGGSATETIKKIRTETPARPKKFQMSLPDLVEGIVLKMLAKQPEDRHQTATELIKDLKRVAAFSGTKL
jgi:serine/threonine protein kinase